MPVVSPSLFICLTCTLSTQMSDPLSMTASLLAVVHTAKQLYCHIQQLVEAPENLKVAGGDLQATVAILESLEHHTRTDTNGSTTVQSLLCQESALSGVLSACRLTCNDFQTKLESCQRHSQSGRFSIRDRLVTSLKDQEIKKFRDDLNSHREIIGLRISVLDLLTTSESHSSLIDFQRKNQEVVNSIEHQLDELNVTIASLQRIPGLYNEDTQKALENEKTALHQRLRVCNENMAADSKENRQVFENTKAGHESDVTLGYTPTGEDVTKNDQTFRATEVGNKAKLTMGFHPETVVNRAIDMRIRDGKKDENKQQRKSRKHEAEDKKPVGEVTTHRTRG